MKYDFETIVDRRNTNSIKWDVEAGELPMWIADMDFKVCPEIIQAMKEKLALQAFGYEEADREYFDAVIQWYEQVHNAHLEADWMIFAIGVIPALSSIVRRVSHVADNVLVQAPVYNIFYNSIENAGRHVISSDLHYDGHSYSIDWNDLEEKLSLPLTTMMILCNPHNPVGKVWTKDELEKISALCEKHHVILVSDEIHGDLIRHGVDYTPAFALKHHKQTISLVSPSKTFNVAALHAATVIIPDKNLRQSVSRGLNSDELAEPNLLAIPATIAAYTQGKTWRDELIEQLNINFDYASSFIADELPILKVVPGTATYLMWIDISKLNTDSATLAEFLRKETGLIVSAGEVYRGNGPEFIRINLACPLSLVKDGMNRLAKGVNKFVNK